MAFKVGTCTGHYELLEIIRRFAKGNGIVGQSSYAGTGDGVMSLEELDPTGTNETFTISCIDIAVTGAELWSVTGSVTGSLGQYTTGDTYAETRVGFKITAGGTNFAIADAFTIVGSAFTGTGNGTIDSIDLAPAAITETWTVACTDATTPGAEVWSVTGSVSGAQATATTGVAYSNTFIDGFTITAGGTNFIVTDQFTFEATISALSNVNQAWVEERYIDNVLDGEGLQDLELILRGPGLSGTEQIWASFTTNQSALSDYYNILLHTHIGYVGGNTLANQPGYIGNRTIPMWDLALKYWLMVNGQRITLACKIETHYSSGYVGKFNAYSTPGQYPYPITIGAMTTTTTIRYSDSYDWDFENSMAVRRIDGTWETFKSLPWNYDTFASGRAMGMMQLSFDTYPCKDTGGDYPLIPIVIIRDSTEEAYGELDGVFYVSGFNSAVENTVVSDAITHIKIANNQGSGFNDYIAMRLD